MEYTVNGLARLAGVSVRTLHWYDEIGLLRPARVTEAGYRMYGPDEVDALQSILFYRALGVPLKQIGALMADASAGRLAALQSHRAALLCRRAQMDALLATLDKTILTEEGKCAMTDAEKFEGFKQKLVADASLPTTTLKRRAARLFCGTRWRLSRAAETVRPQRPA